jgi:hypothetical protein
MFLIILAPRSAALCAPEQSPQNDLAAVRLNAIASLYQGCGGPLRASVPSGIPLANVRGSEQEFRAATVKERLSSLAALWG